MSLYDDLGVETSDSKTEGWSKNFKLLQSQLQVKKAALTQAKSQRTKQSTVLAPVIDLKRGGSSDDRQVVDTPPHVAAGLKCRTAQLGLDPLVLNTAPPRISFVLIHKPRLTASCL